MKQVVVIHGGNEFPNYEEYLSYLKNFKIESADFFKLKNKKLDWKAGLQDALGEEYEVFLPQMPNRDFAKYQEWKIWFERLLPFLNDEVILVGHSLGATFIAKYLDSELFPKTVVATFLVAGPYDKNGDRPMKEFCLPKLLTTFKPQQRSGKVFLYHSSDDPYVPLVEVSKYQRNFPRAEIRVLGGRGHFNQESFPELVVDIRSL